jgi:hypothetical protein
MKACGSGISSAEVAAARGHGKDLARAVWPCRLDRDVAGEKVLASTREPKTRRHPVFEYFKRNRTGTGLQIVRLFVVVLMAGGVGMAVTMIMAAAEQQHARHIDRQSENRNRDCLVEMNHDRPDQTRHRLVADE